MQQINLHKQKLIALALAALGLIFMLLNWSQPTDTMRSVFQLARALGRDPNANPDPVNGFHSWGFIALAGIVGVAIISLTGDKMRPFEGKTKQVALVGFADMSVGAIIYLIELGKEYNSAIGLYLCMLTGFAGLIVVSEVYKKINLTARPATQPPPFHPPPPPSK